jgi:hypothetical protein
LASSCTLFPTTCWAMNVCELTLAVSPPPTHRSRTSTVGWGALRMLWWVRERSRPSSPSQLWVAGSLSPYDISIYLFCTNLLLYSKDVTFVSVPLFIICVRLGPSTPGDYFTPEFGPLKPGCDTEDQAWLRETEWATHHVKQAHLSTSATSIVLGVIRPWTKINCNYPDV